MVVPTNGGYPKMDGFIRENHIKMEIHIYENPHLYIYIYMYIYLSQPCTRCKISPIQISTEGVPGGGELSLALLFDCSLAAGK